jgi:hypothetical protein
MSILPNPLPGYSWLAYGDSVYTLWQKLWPQCAEIARRARLNSDAALTQALQLKPFHSSTLPSEVKEAFGLDPEQTTSFHFIDLLCHAFLSATARLEGTEFPVVNGARPLLIRADYVELLAYLDCLDESQLNRLLVTGQPGNGMLLCYSLNKLIL